MNITAEGKRHLFIPVLTVCHIWQGKSCTFSTDQVAAVYWPFQYLMKQRKLNLWTPAKLNQTFSSNLKSLQYDFFEDIQNKLKTEIKKPLEKKCQNVIKKLTSEMHDKEKRFVNTSALVVVSNWLKFEQSKQHLWDSIRL